MRNSLDRDNFIKRFGKEKFEKLVQTDSYYKRFREPSIPLGCNWIWRHFMMIWQNCNHDFGGNPILSFGEINDYETCMKVKLSLVEKRLILKMKDWAMEKISELNK